ncbi:MAG TPA: MotA/TolQ/ExbB proton channel family protein [Methanophagales archaeon]|nr:MotA/TolQ/ExbB proton channel family protein [Methanophagales archaeon]
MVFDTLLTTLYTVTLALLYPVIIGLLLLLVYSFAEIGAFFSEYTSRNRDLNKLRIGCGEAKKFLAGGEIEKASETVMSSGSSYLLSKFISELSEFIGKGNFKTETEKLLQEYEIAIWERTEKERMLIRVGPMLGLMGTLIPMGPALMNLASGNISEMATNMIVVFSTTVLGLLIGGINYVMAMIKKRWYSQDLSDMEYVVEVLGGDEYVKKKEV